MSNSKKNKYLSFYLLFQKCLIFTVFINNVHCQKFIEIDPHLTFGSHFNKLGEASSTEKVTDWFSHNLKEKVQTIKQSAYSISKVNGENE
ncbi:hypothetical protein ACJRPK_16300 [Aquimarina sp. 2-A2]|uniref:hypothetical protein n=1 Tax=Aquimarina sp. 2-A2 TaxID=3382644 RepID=UPI00387F1567